MTKAELLQVLEEFDEQAEVLVTVNHDQAEHTYFVEGIDLRTFDDLTAVEIKAGTRFDA